MPAAVKIRTDYSAGELRRLASTTKNANQSRRLLSLAAVLDGMNRTEAARIGGMDRQTLRDWVHRFNRSEEHTSELQSRQYLVCRLLLEKKKNIPYILQSYVSPLIQLRCVPL